MIFFFTFELFMANSNHKTNHPEQNIHVDLIPYFLCFHIDFRGYMQHSNNTFSKCVRNKSCRGN